MNKFISETQSIFNINKQQTGSMRMVFSFLSTFIPLLIGHMIGDIIPMIVASLLGHFLFLTDSEACIKWKFLRTILLTILYISCLSLGVILQVYLVQFIILFCVGVYILAISINISKEAETVCLLALINLILGFYSTFVSFELLGKILYYDVFVLIYILTIMFGIHLISPGKDVEKKHIYSEFKQSRKNFHYYGLAFSISCLIGFLLIEEGVSERPYWIIITLLVILKPERKISLHRMVQRTSGTLIGVFFTAIIFHFIHDLNFYLFFVAITCFLLPFCLVKNYALGTVAITVLVVTLLSIPSIGEGGEHLSLIRLTATLWGVFLAIIGLGLYELSKKLKLTPADSSSR